MYINKVRDREDYDTEFSADTLLYVCLFSYLNSCNKGYIIINAKINILYIFTINVGSQLNNYKGSRIYAVDLNYVLNRFKSNSTI